MTLRLVLVGMVAALGVSIPSQPSSENWFESAEAWATSLLAQWDTWEPAEDDAAVPAGKRDQLSCEECRLARLRIVATALQAAHGEPPSPKAVAFEPIRVSEPFETGIAYELNRMAEGLGNTAGTMPESVAATMVTEPPLPADAWEIGTLDELDEDIAIEAEGPTKITQAEVAKLSIADRSDEQASPGADEPWMQAGCLDEVETNSDEVLVFADLPQNVFAPAPPSGAALIAQQAALMPPIGTLAYLARSASTPAGPLPKAGLMPLTGEIPAFGTLAYLSQHRESVTLSGSLPNHAALYAAEPASRLTLADLPRDVFAPAGARSAPAPLQTDHALAGTHSQPARLGDAVELTRRAVSAWVSVLVGPALVDLPRR
jgi:hypothetical protein